MMTILFSKSVIEPRDGWGKSRREGPRDSLQFIPAGLWGEHFLLKDQKRRQSSPKARAVPALGAPVPALLTPDPDGHRWLLQAPACQALQPGRSCGLCSFGDIPYQSCWFAALSGGCRGQEPVCQPFFLRGGRTGPANQQQPQKLS